MQSFRQRLIFYPFRSCQFIFLFLLLAVLAGAFSCTRFSAAKSQGQRHAEALAAKAIKALGGRRALASPPVLTFDFVVENAGRTAVRRTHTWDRPSGRYRLEGIGAEGKAFVTLFNVNTRQGQAFSGNPTTKEAMKPVADPRQALDAAYHDYLADTAWLLGIFHLLDPGVELAFAGQEAVAGRMYNVIAATTTGKAEGLLPGRQNWIYLDTESNRPLAWSTVPEGQQARVTYLYADWQTVGKATLPVRLDRANGPWSIRFVNLLGLAGIAGNVFESPTGPLVRKVKPLKPDKVPPAFVR